MFEKRKALAKRYYKVFSKFKNIIPAKTYDRDINTKNLNPVLIIVTSTGLSVPIL